MPEWPQVMSRRFARAVLGLAVALHEAGRAGRRVGRGGGAGRESGRFSSGARSFRQVLVTAVTNQHQCDLPVIVDDLYGPYHQPG